MLVGMEQMEEREREKGGWGQRERERDKMLFVAGLHGTNSPESQHDFKHSTIPGEPELLRMVSKYLDREYLKYVYNDVVSG